MIVQHAKGGVIVVRYQDENDPEGSASVEVRPNGGGLARHHRT